jgi:hypothetical protein
MSQIKVKFFKTIGVPTDPVPNAIYFVLDEGTGTVNIHVTDTDGTLVPAGADADFILATMAASMALKLDKSALVGPTLLSSILVDLNEGTAAKQDLYTVPALRRGKPGYIEIDLLSNAPTNAEFTIGWNSGANDVLVDPFHLADLITSTADGGQLLGPPRAIRVGAAGESLGLVATTPNGSALTARINVFGYLTDAGGVPISIF